LARAVILVLGEEAIGSQKGRDRPAVQAFLEKLLRKARAVWAKQASSWQRVVFFCQNSMCLISPCFLQIREIRVQNYGIFVSISDFSLFSFGGRETVFLPNVFVENFKEGLSGMPLAHFSPIFGIRLGTCTERP
jgi:hypothetical protein